MYVPAHSLSWPAHRPIGERSYRSLGLHLRILEAQTAPHPWHLEIAIPEPDTHEGLIKVDTAWEGIRQIPVRSIGPGGRRVRVQPQSQPYLLRTQEIPDGDWVRRVSQPIPGLSKYLPTIFRYSTSGGRRLSDQQPLYWGRTYALLWEQRGVPGWWPLTGTGFNKSPLQSLGGWEGALIQLPVEPDRQVAGWAEQLFSKEVDRPPAELSLISPLPVDRLDDGSLVVPLGNELIVGVIGEDGARGWSQIVVWHSWDNRMTRFYGDGKVPGFYSIGHLKPGRTDVWLDEAEDGCLQLVCKEGWFPPSVYPGVEVITRDAVSHRSSSVPLYSDRASKLLRSVRLGESRLVEIRVPDRVSAIVRWRGDSDDDWLSWSTCVQDAAGEPRPLSSEITVQVTNLLSQPNLDLEIDAGEFGVVTLPRLPYTETHRYRRSLSRKWREKASWILALAHEARGSFIEGATLLRPSDLNMINHLNPTDRLLMLKLTRYRPWPRAMITHVRAAIDEWRREMAHDRMGGQP